MTVNFYTSVPKGKRVLTVLQHSKTTLSVNDGIFTVLQHPKIKTQCGISLGDYINPGQLIDCNKIKIGIHSNFQSKFLESDHLVVKILIK